MAGVFYTLQDFLVHTKNITYILMLPGLFGLLGFWHFLTEKDDQ